MTDRPPPAATSDKDEREHCERVLYEIVNPDRATNIQDIIARERAAADKAGYSRGYEDGLRAAREPHDK